MISWDSISKTLAAHSTAIGWVFFFVTLAPVAIAHFEVLEKVRGASGWKKKLRRLELMLLWCVPFLGLVATKSAEWASEKTDEKIKTQGAQIVAQSNQLARAEAKVSELGLKVSPPIEKQLIVLLDEIDPKILSGLAKGNTIFEGWVRESHKAALEQLSAKPKASNFITILECLQNSWQTVDKGTLATIKFKLSTNLMVHIDSSARTSTNSPN